jgi:GT2 family glycosyltransferase
VTLSLTVDHRAARMVSMDISVVIPVRDGAAGLPKAVASALAQDPMPTEVVIAVGASSDDTARVAARLASDPRVRVVDNASGGTAAGLNAAIEATAGQVIVRCDAFAVLPPGYIATAIAALEVSGAANVGGMQVAVGETAFERAVALAASSPLGAGDARYRVGGEAGPVDTVYLGVFRRDVLERVGGFDERFVRTQDAELNERLRAAGEVVWFDPALRVRYRPRGSVRALWRQYFQYGWWRRHLVRRHRRSLRLRQVAAPALVVGLIASAVIAPVAPGLAVMAPGIYGAAVLGATSWAVVRHRTPAALLLPIVLPTMHVAWGVGFLLGQFSARLE